MDSQRSISKYFVYSPTEECSDFPNYLQFEGTIEDKLKFTIGKIEQTTCSYVKIEINSTSKHHKLDILDLYQISWLRREQAKSDDTTKPSSKMTIVKSNKYLCSPKDLGFYGEAVVCPINSTSDVKNNLVVSYGPII